MRPVSRVRDGFSDIAIDPIAGGGFHEVVLSPHSHVATIHALPRTATDVPRLPAVPLGRGWGVKTALCTAGHFGRGEQGGSRHHESVTVENSSPLMPKQRTSSAFVAAVFRGEPFLAKAALQAGVLTKQDLRARFRRIHPRVFARKNAELTSAQKIRAAWLWGGPSAVICGGAAAFLAGEQYFGDEIVEDKVQLWRPVWRSPPPGIVVHRWPLPPPVVRLDGMSVTSPARTAIDLARHLQSDVRAIAALDSMCQSGRTDPDAIASTAFEMAGHTGVRRVIGLLTMVDPGSESPKETEMRLIMMGSGLPRFEPQVKVFDESGTLISKLDLANRQWKVGLQYDGGEHLKRERRDHDSLTMMRLASLGWEIRRVTQGMLHTPDRLTGFAAVAFTRQGWTG